MKKTQNLFLAMCIVLVALFLLCGYSLIKCFVIGYDGDDVMSHIFEISYLFIHLIVVAIIFYLSFKAYKTKSIFIDNLTVDQNGYKYPKKHIVFIVLAALFFILGIYATLAAFGLKMPLYNVMGHVIWHDLMNGCLLLTLIFLSFVIYPYLVDKKGE